MKFKTLTQYCLPHHLLSRLVGKITECRWSWFKNLLINWAITRYKIDVSIAAETNPHKYNNFNDFFTRALNPKYRPVTAGKGDIACPVDGRINQIGKLSDNEIIYAKGFKYNLETLLGHAQESDISAFKNGSFAVLYLSPQDYHRVHMPFAGVLRRMIYIPGKLFSVNPITVSEIPEIFTRNERVVNIFDTEVGSMAVILVGAMLVASIKTVWNGQITPVRKKQMRVWNYGAQEVSLNCGDELGRFQFGSTVVLVFPRNTVRWENNLPVDNTVQMGQLIGRAPF